MVRVRLNSVMIVIQLAVMVVRLPAKMKFAVMHSLT